MQAEQIVSAVWSRILNVAQIDLTDNFFDLGGTSQLAIVAIQEIEAQLDKKIPIILLFDCESLEAFSAAVDALPSAQKDTDQQNLIPLLPGQEGVWFLERLHAGSCAYNIQLALSIHENVEHKALSRSLRQLVQRHEVLRSRIRFDEQSGEPYQIILPYEEVPLRIIDAGGNPLGEVINNFLVGELAARFDLENGPMLHCALLRISGQHSVLSIVMHHTVGDGWSHGIIQRDLAELYSADCADRQPRLASMQMRYSEYVRQSANAQQSIQSKHQNYWRDVLSGVPVILDLPTDRSRNAVATLRGARITMEFDDAFLSRLRDFGARTNATLFMVLLSALATLLARYSEQDDLVIGVPLGNRATPLAHPLVGMFATTVPIRADMKDNPSFSMLVERIREAVIKGIEHQNVPMQVLLREMKLKTRDLSRQPLFQVACNFSDATESATSASQWMPLTGHQQTSQFDLTLYATVRHRNLLLQWEYATDLFERDTIERMAQRYKNILEDVIDEPSRNISEVRLIDESEEGKVLVEWQPPTGSPPTEFVHDMISRQAASSPLAIALEHQGEVLTYEDFDTRSNQLARYLVENGVGREVAVGVCIDRSFDWAIALVAILKAGGVYVPLEAKLPTIRLASILRTARPAIILANRRHEALIAAAAGPDVHSTHVHVVETYSSICADLAVTSPAASLTLNCLAYVFFTSGSTGEPKGACVEHAGFTNHVQAKRDLLKLESGDRIAQTASSAFDICIWQLLAPLTCGGSVAIIDNESVADASELLEALQKTGTTVFQPVPTVLRVLLKDAGAQLPLLERLRIIVPTGEALPPELCELWFEVMPDVPIVNAYGATECSDDFTHHLLTTLPTNAQSIPIGRPIANSRVYVLDQELNLVPIGMSGEIHVEGIVVGRGYLGQPGLTAAAFVPSRWSRGGRLYKTGDRGRWLADGTLEFLGRVDNQVKVRGFRVELGEIEATMLDHPSIEEAIAIVYQTPNGDSGLAAYVVAREDSVMVAPDELKDLVKGRLPQYMVPDYVISLSKMPTNANGKIDRARLPRPGPTRSVSASVQVLSPLEATIAGVWSAILQVEHLGPNDNFFELGGHSLLAVRIARRLREELDVKVGVVDIFRSQTIAQLAQEIERMKVILNS